MIINSQYKDVSMRGTIDQIIQKWEGLAYGAERDGDIVTAHIYRQHSDHYKREKNESIKALDSRRGRVSQRPMGSRRYSGYHRSASETDNDGGASSGKSTQSQEASEGCASETQRYSDER